LTDVMPITQSKLEGEKTGIKLPTAPFPAQSS